MKLGYGCLLWLWLGLGPVAAWAAVNSDSLVVHAVRAAVPPLIDGHLSDAAWSQGIVAAPLTQRDPLENTPPSQRTAVVVLYDDDALYVGARLFDSAPDSIIARLARRDVDTQSDLFVVYLDPYHDHRTGYHFALNAAGTRYDGTRYNDDWNDDTWDGVWDGAVSRDAEGWTAEFRIPFSQLRFNPAAEQVWGINFKRIILRRNEQDYLAFTPKNGSGFVSRFWNLEGLGSVTPPRYTELIPYGRARARYQDHDPGDPFHDNAEYRPNVGADMKIGLGSKMTLNATVNPDFGQVEVDPAVVNLSDVETTFSEKRPFFVDGSSFFSFGQGGATDYWGFNWSGPSLFYSRRIGRPPQGSLPDYSYADIPDGAHILGAAKVTGKLRGNWNIGSLHALTMREYADYDNGAGTQRQEVEPAAYYTVNRTQHEMNEGRQGVGAILTSSQRLFHEDGLRADMNGQSYVGGLDGWTALDKDKTYMLAGWGGFSHVRGTAARITDLQQASTHYFQRPDAAHVAVDSAATSLTGFAGRLTLNKEKGNVILNSAVGTLSPGYDVNDLGYNSRADVINSHVGFGYKWTQPTKWTHYANVLGAFYTNFDYGGHNTWAGFWSDTYLQYRSYYSTDLSIALNPRTLNATRTRGGPLTENPPGWEFNFNGYSDDRRPWVFGLGCYGYAVAGNDRNAGVWLSAKWKPAANLDVQVAPEIFWNKDWVAWVDSFEDPAATRTFGNRYVYGELDQTQLSASIRMNWTFTPKLSLQLYAQPLITSGDYFNFKELSRPHSYSFHVYNRDEIQFARDTDGYGSYTVDPDATGPASSFSFDDPNFDVRSLRGNMILRWEYLPGSTLFLVWTHGRSQDGNRGEFNLRRSLDRLARADQDNILLVKATYWLSL